MPTLRGIFEGQTFELDIRVKEPVSDTPCFECRLQMGGSENSFLVEVISRVGSRWTLRIDGRIEDLIIGRPDGQILIDWNNQNYRLTLANSKDLHPESILDQESSQNVVRAEMIGKVVAISKKEGDAVTQREPLATIEAMKMLNQVKSPKDGRVKRCHVKVGTIVNPGDLLFEIE
ncbi:MAG TPA: biotin/lipoyl-binding protein [Acidobacteriota bacterium]|nr:biotin/lipoyl-binding protein [Acidobacteriota bacterium]